VCQVTEALTFLLCCLHDHMQIFVESITFLVNISDISGPLTRPSKVDRGGSLCPLRLKSSGARPHGECS